ncbi:hypothetical protein [Cryptosporangium japonicum]|uniref:Uncharacterized protein n=1 Tax=Cryptosporangium japonicum TaxID=80872 RepID=A0ABN0TJU9_9ACTN
MRREALPTWCATRLVALAVDTCLAAAIALLFDAVRGYGPIVVAVIGAVVRIDADHVGRFGTAVDANCTTTTRMWLATTSTRVECPSTTFWIGDEPIVGAMRVTLDDPYLGDDPIPAYAIDRRIVSRSYVGTIAPIAVLGGYLPWGSLAAVPRWVVLLGRLVLSRRAP